MNSSNKQIFDTQITPKIVTLEEAITSNSEPFPLIPYTDFTAQSDYRIFGMSFTPKTDEIDRLVSDYSLTDKDKRKYLEIVEEINTLHPEFLDTKVDDITSILKFTLAVTWLVTGSHNLEGTADAMFQTDFSASDLVDISNPPPTRCSFFNSAFVYLFISACKHFKKEDLLSRYQFINVPKRTHHYPALVTMRDGQYYLTAIDPYHTASTDSIDKSAIDIDNLYSKLDKTSERAEDLPIAFETILEKNNSIA